MRSLAFMAVGLFALPLLGATAEAGPEVIESEAYRFRLSSPGAGWHVLDAEGMQAMGTEALAGLAGPKAQWGAVMAEEAPHVARPWGSGVFRPPL